MGVICSASPATGEGRRTAMVRTFLVRGMLVGLVAGLLAFCVGRLLGEPQVDGAIAFEEQHAGGHSHDMAMGGSQDTATGGSQDVAAGGSQDTGNGGSQEMAMAGAPAQEELVSRGVQSTVGLFTGVVVFGTALGGLFALVFAFAQWLASASSVPRRWQRCWPPRGFWPSCSSRPSNIRRTRHQSVETETIVYRTELYFLMLLMSVAALVLAVSIGRQLAGRYGAWNSTLAAAAVFLVIIVVAQLLLPPVNEVPAQFPADVLWSFRVTSLAMQVVLWTTIGLGFGMLTERDLMASRRLAGPARPPERRHEAQA